MAGKEHALIAGDRARRRPGASGWLLAAAAIGALVLVSAGCNQKRTIQPVLPTLAEGVPQRPAALGLYIDKPVLAYSYASRTRIDDLGIWHMTLDFQLGDSLREVIENTTRSRFRDVTRVADKRCPPGAEGLLLVSFAKNPAITTKWEEGIWKVGGVTTAEFTLNLVAERCDATILSRHVVVGYGSEARKGFWNWPGKGDFRPGMDAALADLALNLDKTLAGITFPEAMPAEATPTETTPTEKTP